MSRRKKEEKYLAPVLPGLGVEPLPGPGLVLVVEAASAEEEAEEEVEDHDDHGGEGDPAHCLSVDKDLLPGLGEAALHKCAVSTSIGGHAFLLHINSLKSYSC